VLFFNRIVYFTGNAVYPTRFVRAVRPVAQGHFFNAELLIRVLARFQPEVVQIPFELASRKVGNSKALRLASLVDAVSMLIRLRVSLWLERAIGL
jgi:hypothetical protein